jgi:hypothetical protein
MIPSRRTAILTAMAASALAFLPALTARADTTEALFVIERSKNANVVHYDAQVGKDGALNAKDPVVAYWIMKAEDGRREPLTWAEKQMAYGFDVQPLGEGGNYLMKLTAYKDRSLRLTKVNGRWRAKTTIAGKSAYLTKLYIATKEGGLTPTVLSVDLHGEDADTGKAIQEHIAK